MLYHFLESSINEIYVYTENVKSIALKIKLKQSKKNRKNRNKYAIRIVF